MIRRNIYLINMDTDTGKAMTLNGDFPNRLHSVDEPAYAIELYKSIREDINIFVKNNRDVEFTVGVTYREVKYVYGDYYEDCYIRVDLGDEAFVPISDQALNGVEGKAVPKNILNNVKGMMYCSGAVLEGNMLDDTDDTFSDTYDCGGFEDGLTGKAFYFDGRNPLDIPFGEGD